MAELRSGAQVVAGTAWLWAREDYFEAVDVLFVDEAGQMSLANVLAIQPGVNWMDSEGQVRALQAEDILVVAPYNAQVSDLLTRLPQGRIGTVDKFQGQQAPVVIYSLTTSSPEDAPRGMEFLYSLNRLNVATSRAQAMVIVVGSPLLLEPERHSPRQMHLANALCRYVEVAQVVEYAALKAGYIED